MSVTVKWLDTTVLQLQSKPSSSCVNIKATSRCENWLSDVCAGLYNKPNLYPARLTLTVPWRLPANWGLWGWSHLQQSFCLSEHGALTCVCQAQSTTTHYFYLAFNSQAGSCWLCFLFFPLQISNRWFVQASPCQTHQVRFLESCSHSGWRSAACSSTQNLCQRELWSEPKKPGFVKGLLSQVLISYYYYHTVKNHLKSHFTFFLYSHLQAYMS